MPKLTFPQWLLAIAFLVLYGAVVFAVTRAYYLEQSPPRQALSQAPQTPPAEPVSGLGRTMQRFGAGSVVQREELTTTDPVLLARLGDQFFEQGQLQRAMTAYERTLRFDPNDTDTYNDLGLTLHYLGQSQRAVQVLQQGASRDAAYQRIHLTLGFVQLQSGDTEAAAAALQRAVDLGPETSVGVEAQRLLGELATP